LSKLYVATYSDMSNDCETEILDGDIDIPTVSHVNAHDPVP